MARGVYIHIPFCHQICNYCDFNKVFFKNQPVDEYIEAVGKEMQMVVHNMPDQFDNIETIFLGGGTPTALSAEQIKRLLDLIHKYIPTNRRIEFSSEANPDELTIDKLKALYNGGVNRLSMGVQSFDEELLKKLGRTHSNEHVYETIEHAKSVGFQNISIDLMYGLPGQTMEQWEDTLNKALRLKLPHYSAYSLIVEPKTIFYIRYAKGKLNLPSEELEAEMYDLLMRKMEENGLKQYEISNFALDGYQSTHNKIYWDNDEYAGFGAGAHGYLKGERYSNYGPIKRYIDSVMNSGRPLLQTHKVSIEEMYEEQMFLGLRKNEGVSVKEFERKFGVHLKDLYGETIQQLEKDALLINDGHHVKLTRKGRFIGNEVFQQFLIED
ncbi:oxygen-independent coproporphyrinogen-3 oxidase [Ureibacillus xyleni]|uniref:Heme chaperone HemW n=1 Tax=Ureibacillus xyleni TaxID=614648 RepID=A0A285TJ97_9BACL|nr:radical SAM family heme chaperone HemW [Ureibacillus xyleni]SOC20796.1 oxygen-independent coproporphyrinogen-3 oxidase [Ureibacillus xyleni]